MLKFTCVLFGVTTVWYSVGFNTSKVMFKPLGILTVVGTVNEVNF